MTPAKKVRSCGLSGLDEMSELSTRPKPTLITWFTTKPELFDVVLSGCIVKKLNASLARVSDEYNQDINNLEGEGE